MRRNAERIRQRRLQVYKDALRSRRYSMAEFTRMNAEFFGELWRAHVRKMKDE